MKIVLSREDSLGLSKWIVGLNLIATRLRSMWPPSLVGYAIALTELVSIHFVVHSLMFLLFLSICHALSAFIFCAHTVEYTNMFIMLCSLCLC